MSLDKYSALFARADFDYISDNNKITFIKTVIRYNIKNSNGQEAEYIRYFQEYLSNLRSFYDWIGKNIPPINQGYTICSEELSKCIALFSEPIDKKAAISGRSLRSTVRSFIGGLMMIKKGIIFSFLSENVNKTNITNSQMVRYFFDYDVGLRSKGYRFHDEGKFAFAKRINNMDKGELIMIERLLENPEAVMRRSEKGWNILGRGTGGVRILMKKKMMRKDLYFLFKNNQSERAHYEKHLQNLPNNIEFKAA